MHVSTDWLVVSWGLFLGSLSIPYLGFLVDLYHAIYYDTMTMTYDYDYDTMTMTTTLTIIFIYYHKNLAKFFCYKILFHEIYY